MHGISFREVAVSYQNMHIHVHCLKWHGIGRARLSTAENISDIYTSWNQLGMRFFFLQRINLPWIVIIYSFIPLMLQVKHA